MLSEGNKIKLIQVIADSDLGGGAIHVLGILKNIDQDKFKVFLICPKGLLSAEAKKIEGVEVLNVAMDSKFDIGSMLKIRDDIAKIRVSNDPFGPIIVHTHGTRAGFLTRPILPSEIIDVYTEHRWDKDYHLKNKFNNFFQINVSKKLNLRSDLIIAVSSSVKEYLISQKMADANKTIVIPNGIDFSDPRFEHKKIVKIETDPKHLKIGTIGNLNAQKGHKYLIEAMKKVVRHFPLITLEIVGEGEERENLSKLIKNSNLSHNITLLGKKKSIGKYLESWNLFVLPSVAETFGIVILEAMNFGLPIVATRAGGITDIITNEKNGILVSSRNSNELAAAIIKILSKPVLAAKLKRGGLDRVKDYDWSNVIKMIEKQYISLAEK